jgi:hypothetical protein
VPTTLEIAALGGLWTLNCAVWLGGVVLPLLTELT